MSRVWVAGRRPHRELFRVQHDDSATNRTSCGGFSAGNPQPPKNRQFRAAFIDHVLNRHKLSPFISVVDTPKLAAERATRLENNGCSGVRICVINPRAAEDKVLHVWCVARYFKYFIPKRINRYTVGEHVYMSAIPGIAVGKEYTSVREFREYYDLEGEDESAEVSGTSTSSESGSDSDEY